MQPTDFAKGRAWAMLPEKFELLARRFHQFQADDAAVKKLAGFAETTDEPPYYDLRDSVAVIPISGPLTKRRSFWSFLFGGSSYAEIARTVAFAAQDPEVSGIVLDIDSPGGTISGVEAAGDAIFAARQQKPLAAFANGTMASAAYWLGSAADTVIAEKTAAVGSIGVLMVHYDWSVALANEGIKISYLTAGRYKALGNPAEPLSREARDVFQAELDQVYGIFVDTVARNRNVSRDQVLADMADGRVFIGAKAVAAGLADTLGSLDTAIAAVQDMAGNQQSERRIFAMTTKTKEIKIETTEQLAAAYPDLAQALRAQGADSVDTAAIAQKAADEERARILGLAGVQFGAAAGEKFTAVVETGVTVAQFTAITAAAGGTQTPADAAAANLEKAKADQLAAIQAAGAANPGADSQAGQSAGKDFMALVAEYAQANKCGRVEAMQAVMKANPAAHKAYITKVN